MNNFSRVMNLVLSTYDVGEDLGFNSSAIQPTIAEVLYRYTIEY